MVEPCAEVLGADDAVDVGPVAVDVVADVDVDVEVDVEVVVGPVDNRTVRIGIGECRCLDSEGSLCLEGILTGCWS